MVRRYSPQQQVSHAHALARDHGLYVVEKSTATGLQFILYRKTPGRSIYLGRRSSPKGIRQYVEKIITPRQESI